MLTRHILPNLRTRLVAVIFLALLPAFVLVVSIAALERSRAKESAKLESMALAQLLRSQYEEVISNSQRSLQWLAQLPEVTGPDAPACSARLEEFYRVSGQFLGLSVARPDGTVRLRSSSASTVRHRDECRPAILRPGDEDKSLRSRRCSNRTGVSGNRT